MKLTSLAHLKTLNETELIFVQGGKTSQRLLPTRGNDNTENDSIRRDWDIQ